MDEAELVRDSKSEQQSWMPTGMADKEGFSLFLFIKFGILLTYL